MRYREVTKKLRNLGCVELITLVFICSAVVLGQNRQNLGTVTISVVDDAGSSISDTRVTLYAPGGTVFSGLTDDRGDLELIVPKGKYSITAEYIKHNGWKRFRQRGFIVNPDRVNTIRIVLKVNLDGGAGGLNVIGKVISKTGGIEGTVYDPSGALVAGYPLNVRDKRQAFTATTGPNGKYSIKMPTGVYIVEFRHPYNLFCPLRIVNYRVVENMSLDIVLPRRNSVSDKCKMKTIEF